MLVIYLMISSVCAVGCLGWKRSTNRASPLIEQIEKNEREKGATTKNKNLGVAY